MEAAFQPLIDAIAEAVARRLLERERRMVPQADSPLGARRHREAVKRRLAAGERGAAIVGRRFLLSPEALDDELGRLGLPANDQGPAPRAGAAALRGVAKTNRERELTDYERRLRAKLREAE